MARNTTHPLQPRTTHDGVSRQLAVLASKRAIRAVLEPPLREALAEGSNPEASEAYRYWSAATRRSQDRMWSVLADQVDHDYDRIAATAGKLADSAKGTLETGEDVPAYQKKACIHGQPGGYMLERDGKDLAAGILYEAGGNIYALGQGIGNKDSKAQRIISHLRETYPDLAPKRILEMGCSAGGQTTDYPAAFPDADVHAIDLSPGMLRFAHARAEALGATVHFHQMDAGHTTFPDGHFDLIISHNLFHEVAGNHMPAIAAESRRLLAPGGICLHQDVPIQTKNLDPFTRFLSEWQQDNNDEPFWMDFANADLPALLVDAGFAAENVSATYLQAVDGPVPWYVVTAVREADD